MDLDQINAKQAKERCANFERGRVYLLSFCANLGQFAEVVLLIGGQCRQRNLKMAITFQHLGLIEVIELQ